MLLVLSYFFSTHDKFALFNIDFLNGIGQSENVHQDALSSLTFICLPQKKGQCVAIMKVIDVTKRFCKNRLEIEFLTLEEWKNLYPFFHHSSIIIELFYICVLLFKPGVGKLFCLQAAY